MFLSQFKEKIEEIPVEFLHRAKSQRKKKKNEYLRTTESIISEKVKKYLNKLFAGSLGNLGNLKSISSRSSSNYNIKIQQIEEEFKSIRNPGIHFCFPEKKMLFPKYYHKKHHSTTKKLSSSFPRKLIQKNLQSLNNLYNADSCPSSCSVLEPNHQKKIPASKDQTSTTALQSAKSNSFCEIINQLIKKQKKKHRNPKAASKKLKKTTKSSISSMCDRAKLLLHDSFVEEPEATEKSVDGNIPPEDTERTLFVDNLNSYNAPNSSGASLKVTRSNTLESIEFYSRCSPPFNCKHKISSCTNLHHSSFMEQPPRGQDFEANLEVWTTHYINGLVGAHAPTTERPQASLIPVKKNAKSVKTKSKKSVKSDASKLRNLTDCGRNSLLLGDVEAVRGNSCRTDEMQRLKTGNRDLYSCQKIQDIQDYIDNLTLPKEKQKCCRDSEPGLLKHALKPCPDKQSIKELKKFQRELKMRIKELERKVPAPSPGLGRHKNTNCTSDHELSFINLSNFLDEDDDYKPKMVNEVQYCTKKHNFNLKVKFGDKFCECCFLNANKPKNDMCRRCNKQVYLVERICAGEGIYHKFCYSCFYCKRSLNSLNLCVTRGEVFCKQCFKKYFGPEVYGFLK